MSEKKHTPGPWTLETVRTSVGLCHKIGPFPWKQDRQNHACIYVDYPDHDWRGPFEDELMANARLISAAPDLLEALRFFVEHPGVSQLCTSNSKAMESARAAIAKALGVQS